MISPADNLRRRRLLGKAFEISCLAATWICITALVVLLAVILYRGVGWLSWTFLTNFPSRFPAKAGVKSAFVGSLLLVVLTTIFSLGIGVATAIYLEEYARRGRLVRAVQINISNLAGVPSIVYGILGLGLFVRSLSMGKSLLAGSLTLTLLVLPIIIIATQEAIRAVPDSIRHASYALGASRWQTVRHQVLPVALPSILTGVILALSRAVGEAAPLIMVGALGYVAFVPTNLHDSFTALPVQIFNWSSRPQHEFHNLAAAGIIVLLALLFLMNATAVFIRRRYSRRLRG